MYDGVGVGWLLFGWLQRSEWCGSGAGVMYDGTGVGWN